MSAVFSAASHRIQTNLPPPAPAGTILEWIKPNTNWKTDNTDHHAWWADFGGVSLFGEKWEDNQFYVSWHGGGNSRIIIAASAFTMPANAWALLGLSYNNNGTTNPVTVTLNGVSIGTGTVASATALNALTIGNLPSGTGDVALDGKIGRTLVYSSALSVAAHAAEYAGTITAGYIARYDFNTNYNSSVGGYTGTNSGTTLDTSDNPPLILPGNVAALVAMGLI